MYLFATDFDDTLYFHEGQGFHPGQGLRKEDEEAIRRFQQDGNLFVLCTGRPMAARDSVMDLVDGRVQFDYEIYSCGSLIRDKEGNILHKEVLPPSFVEYALTQFPEVNYIIHHEKGLFCTRRINHPGGILCSDLDVLLNGDVYELTVDYHETEAADVLPELINRPEVAHYTNKAVVDFVKGGVSKATGIARLAKMAGVDAADCASMGDSFNDITMLSGTAHSFTFPDSEESVKQAAKTVCGSLAEAIELVH